MSLPYPPTAFDSDQSCLKHFLLLAPQDIFLLPPDCVFSFSFGGFTSYSSLLTVESLNLFSSLSIPSLDDIVLSHDFTYHLNADDSHVYIPSPFSSLNFYSSASLTSSFRFLLGILNFTCQALSSWPPLLKAALPIVLPILLNGIVILPLLMCNKNNNSHF